MLYGQRETNYWIWLGKEIVWGIVIAVALLLGLAGAIHLVEIIARILS